jgi:alanyl-tRNA synthetase
MNIMNSKEVRQQFFDFFQKKGHRIIASAPIVVKNDPTLMFTNAGMNQFKDIFLENKKADHTRIANTQKCLRVSGKHNDLEEVGKDTYHHTMFEMLGNWSFGDYFKKEAVAWAWELLTKVYQIPEERFYATYFGGDTKDQLEADAESRDLWLELLPEDHVIPGSKKDNFWEMGDTGPCGPCSEIHVDIRKDAEREQIPGKELVNQDHPELIEIWNLVFIQYNRKADSSLVALPKKHVDTGMGFERLCMLLQGKKSNYDTDIFQSLISKIAALSGIPYGQSEQNDIAMRVIADHLRAIAFSIADGQLPSNTGAGYVIRRILRRAVRYYYSFLHIKEAFMFKIIPVLCEIMGAHFPELKKQKDLISKVIREEEDSFLRTLEKGLKLLDQIIENTRKNKEKAVSGKALFELYDTYGFPLDLTALILEEQKLTYDAQGFEQEMQEQKSRSRLSGTQESDDWIIVHEGNQSIHCAYDSTEEPVKILRYRKVHRNKKTFFHIVLDKTPFYAESGGQVGDKGVLQSGREKISVFDTQKENDLILHFCEKEPQYPEEEFIAMVDGPKRISTMKNHSATHLLQQALRKVLGPHIEQKGSLVDQEHLRFDFSHFQKVSNEELSEIEAFVNEKIRENHKLHEERAIPLKKATDMGAIAFFGEKYGELVRVIRFGDSIELCGGTHVHATGEIGLFRIISESAIAAGIRRIEACTGAEAIQMMQKENQILREIQNMFGLSAEKISDAIKNIQSENKKLQKEIEILRKKDAIKIREHLVQKAELIDNQAYFISGILEPEWVQSAKDIVFDINRNVDNAIILLAAAQEKKASLWLMISKNLLEKYALDAAAIIREISVEIEGGGGGQAFFATAGGKNIQGMQKAIDKAKTIFVKAING